MFVGKGKGENNNLKEFVWTTIFKIFSPKISGRPSQEDNQILIFGCPHSIFGRRGHANFVTLNPLPDFQVRMHISQLKASQASQIS